MRLRQPPYASVEGDVPVLQPLSAATATAAATDKMYLQMFLLLRGRIICFLLVRLAFVLVPLTRW